MSWDSIGEALSKFRRRPKWQQHLFLEAGDYVNRLRTKGVDYEK